MRTLTTALAAITLTTSTALAPPAGADPEIEHVPLEVTGSINDVDVAHDAETDRSVVVWSDGPDLDAALLDADGTILVGPITIPEVGAVSRPAIERTDDGWVVVYHSGGIQDEIRSRHLSEDLVAGPSVQLTPTGNDEQWELRPDLVWLGDVGQLLVTWHSSVPFASGRYESIRVRPLTATGAAAGPATTLISETFVGSQHRTLAAPAIGAAPDGQHALVAVRGDLAGAGLAEEDHEVIARPVDAAGLPNGPVTVVSDLAVDGLPGDPFGNHFEPSVAAFGDHYLVAYRGDDGAGLLPHGRVVDLTGSPVDAGEQVLVEGAGTGWSLSVAPDGSGGVIAAASDQYPGDLRVQRLALDGTTIAPATATIVLEPNGSSVVDVAGDPVHAVIGSAAGGQATADLWERSRVTSFATPDVRLPSPTFELRG